MVFDKDMPERGKLTYQEQVIEKSLHNLKKKQIKNSHEMMPSWHVQSIKLETQRERINK